MRTDEFDAFGPWIDDVTTVEGTPRLFRSFAIDFTETLLVLKVPRNIARRDATPDMNLYDQLIVVTAETLTVLTRAEDVYGVRAAPHGEVLALQDTVHLLDGRLVVHLTSGPSVAISYNGAARDTITRLVTLLRRLAVPATSDSASATAPAAPEPTAPATQLSATSRSRPIEQILRDKRDHGLRSDCVQALRSDPGTTVVAGHSTTLVRPSAGPLAALSHRLHPAFVQGAVVLGDTGGETSVLHRRDWIARGRADDLSHGRTTIFAGRATTVATTEHPVYPAASVVNITSGAGAVQFVVPMGSPTGDALENGRTTTAPAA
ncbi:hypothetical protein [Marisediminicola sp. LYQ134]|uniref:hypothetical protein n=1 Tax=Marisediminicola sp. LYQ134 TaxID=3391061 RepID=UPI003982F46B